MEHLISKVIPYSIPLTKQRSIVSDQTKRSYRIYTAKPQQEGPPEGYPVIYVLDANAVFGTIVEALRVQSRRSQKTGVVPAVIVGIGYDTDEPFHESRHYDFTMLVPRSELPAHPEGKEWPPLGGAEGFLNFIEEELQPMIEQDYPINRNRQTIVGHSLGGLFVLHALYKKPWLFQNYVAGSPSIHWNRSVLMEEEQRFIAELGSGSSLKVKLLVAAGELEKGHFSRMNENAIELCRRLSHNSGQGFEVEYEEFTGENHGSAMPVLMNRAIRLGSRE